MMHQSIKNMFSVSLVAIAVMALTGCANTPDAGRIGESMMDAGRVTAQLSSRAYQGTRKFLGFDRNHPQQPELDEVDIALMDKDELLSGEEQSAAVITPVQTNTVNGLNLLDSVEAPPENVPAIAAIPAIDPNALPVATSDHMHIVGPNETMWTIAKTMTGNPNNWRILAEINQLDLNTPMQIGQEVVIPADLVRPELVASLNPGQPTNNIQALESTIQPLELEPVSQSDLATDPLQPRLEIPAGDEVIGEPIADDTEVAAIAEPQPVIEPEVEKKSAIDLMTNALPLTADAGETLWDMAKRTTGDATNWKVIAEHNGFTERDIGRIRYGQTIYVPESIARIELGGDNVVFTDSVGEKNGAIEFANEPETVAVKAESQQVDALDASAELVASAGNLMDETQELKIVEAKFQTDEPVNASLDADTPAGNTIMVSGTYYPKAVYHEADFSSSLLMRVSPGTELRVSREIGPWFEVETEIGIGYMHSRDIK